MSFFDSIGEPREEPRPEPERVMPPWLGPPEGVLPGALRGTWSVFRTESMAFTLGKIGAYPTGIVFTLDLWMRQSVEHWDGMPWEPHRPTRARDDPEFLRIGLLFADGSRWSNLDGFNFAVDTEPDGPICVPRGGGGGGRHWSMEQWLWPLPPPGDMTVYASWPAHGIEETSVTLDGAAIRSAAEDAEQLWPDEAG